MMKKGLDLGMPMKEAEGASLLQMGMLAMQKNDIRKAEGLIRQAISKGLPDKENQAAAYLQLCSIMMTKREFRASKEFFRKAKNLKPTYTADRGSDQTNREVYFEDSGLTD
jgi:Tfp pilus assembly protein PilF